MLWHQEKKYVWSLYHLTEAKSNHYHQHHYHHYSRNKALCIWKRISILTYNFMKLVNIGIIILLLQRGKCVLENSSNMPKVSRLIKGRGSSQIQICSSSSLSSLFWAALREGGPMFYPCLRLLLLSICFPCNFQCSSN